MAEGLIIIPAFNEAGSIGPVVAASRAKAPGFDILVVDDGSADATAARAGAAGAVVARHPFNIGYGAALQTGYRWALKHGYPLAVQIDADGQHDPAEVPRLAAALKEDRADAVVGSRFHPASSYRMPPLRRIGSLWFGALVATLTGLRLSDPTSGLQALSTRALELYATGVFPVDYPDADMLVLLDRNGLKVTEAAVTMEEKPESPSMHSGIGTLYYVYKMTLAIVMNLIRKPLQESAE